MTAWTDVGITALSTFVAAGVGTLVGGFLTLKAARESIRAQRRLSQEEREAQAEFAARQRELDQREQRSVIGRNAAVELVDRVAELWRVVPRLPEVKAAGHQPGMWTQEPRTSEQWRAKEIADVLDSFSHAGRATLFLVGNEALAGRYRALGVLGSELAYGSIEPDSPIMNRAIGDVENYAKYLVYSLRQFIDGQPLPRHTDPPYLHRPMEDGANWLPGDIPSDWDQI